MLYITTIKVGFGDYYPVTEEGKYLNCVFIICNLLVFGYLFSNIFEYLYAKQEAMALAASEGKQDVDKVTKTFKSIAQIFDEKMAEATAEHIAEMADPNLSKMMSHELADQLREEAIPEIVEEEWHEDKEEEKEKEEEEFADIVVKENDHMFAASSDEEQDDESEEVP